MVEIRKSGTILFIFMILLVALSGLSHGVFMVKADNEDTTTLGLLPLADDGMHLALAKVKGVDSERLLGSQQESHPMVCCFLGQDNVQSYSFFGNSKDEIMKRLPIASVVSGVYSVQRSSESGSDIAYQNISSAEELDSLRAVVKIE